jgi:hypothetical protein
MSDKQMIRRVGLLVGFSLLLGLILVGTGCSRQDIALAGTDVPAQRLYTAWNLWCENPDRMFCINYQVGSRIPAGTEVTNVQIYRLYRPFRLTHDVIRFTTVPEGRTYTVFMEERFHPGVDIRSYKEAMFTPKNFEQLTAGMTPTEVKSIREGTLYMGMSREAVQACYGLPFQSRTPSLTNNMWVYPTNRWGLQELTFGPDGKLAAFRNISNR